ncbi:hypothetical protein H9650_11400 [Psychrobacillus sp. Sa2BUA9]|uniref:SMI1/KNR4 family protein n=1 Tax=Psychrobacillus faecigallinarum TaxID=2762235 RepID=A0ABR8RAE3_9BACI|nr:hypothetical protein [Psychrobacillus faecigallinarum]MBD7944721.1 hypothetical protein [Psychrobacillus faecigallinarum]
MIINLQKDYKKLMMEKINNSNLRLPENFSDDRLIIHYINYLRKKSFAGPHKIVKSSNFSCPPEYKKGFTKLEEIISNGGDITPYFNRTASDLSKYDDLFSEWGVLHFHLGDEFIKGEHLVKRGNPVLFAYLHEDTVYFIDIYKHGHWTDFGVIQTMFDNWPEIINPYVIPDAISLNKDITSSELKETRKSGSLVLFTIKDSNGKNICLMPPGMGLNTARSSIQDTRIYDDAMNKLREIQLHLISIEDEIKLDMENRGIILNQEISFELMSFNEQELYLLDSNHQYTITYGL